MLRNLFVMVLTLLPAAGFAQRSNPAIDTITRRLSAARSAAERVNLLGALSKIYINENFSVSDSIGRKMIEEAELSRDRTLMAEALLINGERNSYFAARNENFKKAVDFYNQALELTKQNKMDKEIARSYLALSSLYRNVPDADKSYSYVNQALSYISLLDNDSLKVLGHIELGSVYALKREKLLSLRNYLNALRLAEDLKDPGLKRSCYNALTNFYSSIEDFDKAIDFAVKALNLLDEIKEGNSAYAKPISLNAIASLYTQKKNYEMANYYLKQSIRLADSLHYDPLKIPAYMGMISNYLLSGKPVEALQYLSNNSEIKNFAAKFGVTQQVDYSYGYIYTDLGKYDSARYYYNRAASFFEKSSTEGSKYLFYFQLGRMYKMSGDNAKAIENYLKAKEVAYRVADPERIKLAAKELDTVYFRTGDYRQSQFYTALYFQYKDSIEKLGKEKDFLQEEAEDEQKREERIRKEQEELKRRKNNIQYMAITFGIVILFVMLVILGMFRISAGLIKAIGFFVFLMLFEFIFLVFKKNIHSVTHGEPWKDLVFMIALAALLVPLHHWLEHKVLHYLTSHNRLTSAGHHIKNKLLRRTKKGEL